VIGNHALSQVIRQDLANQSIHSIDLEPTWSDSPSVSSVIVTQQTGERAVISLNATKFQAKLEQIPPDIDVSGFPNSDIVSRIHADIRLEGDTYYIEDVGSANGTYINHGTLIKGNRHRLRAGDRISLGKGDLMTFIFQLT
jgi:pSer/pThr/pTyr-binding forkhead associated (FHA) protein